MVTSKALPMGLRTVKVAIIGPRSYSIGGHDVSDGVRGEIFQYIKATLENYVDKYPNVIGLTGLGLGVDQDFVLACNALGVSYIAYVPYSEQGKKWDKLPQSFITDYDKYLEDAHQKTILSEGNYSPKKVFQKNIRLIKEADVIIYIPNRVFTRLNQYEFGDKVVHTYRYSGA